MTRMSARRSKSTDEKSQPDSRKCVSKGQSSKGQACSSYHDISRICKGKGERGRQSSPSLSQSNDSKEGKGVSKRSVQKAPAREGNQINLRVIATWKVTALNGHAPVGIINFVLTDGYTWSGWRLARKQTTSRLDNVCLQQGSRKL